VIRDMPS